MRTLEELDIAMREIQDRQAIYDCLTAHTRGLDRMDRDLFLSAFHEDAIDDHGGVRLGGREGFWVDSLAIHSTYMHSTQHIMTNHRCQLDGDVAHTETYFMFACMNKEPSSLWIHGGRYIDRFERRDGKWGIVVHKVVRDWAGVPGEGGTWATENFRNSFVPVPRDRTDPSYDRPLMPRTELP